MLKTPQMNEAVTATIGAFSKERLSQSKRLVIIVRLSFEVPL